MILTKVQIQDQLNKFIAKSGINELLNLMLNSLMYIERKVFLQSEEQCKNKANGFRKPLPEAMEKYCNSTSQEIDLVISNHSSKCYLERKKTPSELSVSSSMGRG